MSLLRGRPRERSLRIRIEFRLYGILFTPGAPANKKLSGCVKGVDARRNFSRMFQKAYTPAQTFFGRRKCFAGLQELSADVAKGMHTCGNIFWKAKSSAPFPEIASELLMSRNSG